MKKKLLNYMVSIGKLLPRATTPKNDPNASELPQPKHELRQVIRGVLASNAHPLVQPDLVDATTLLYLLKRGNPLLRLSPWGLAKELQALYFRSLGPIQYSHMRLNVWTSLPVQPMHNIVRKIHQRVSAMPGVSLDVRGEPSSPIVPPPPSRPLAP